MPGKVELYKDKRGGFRFRLKATNGQISLASEGCKAKPRAKNGIASVMKNAAEDARLDRKSTQGGQFMFNLKATNRKINILDVENA